MPDETLFKSLYPEFIRLIEKRRGSWELTTILEWQDVSSILLTRLWEKLDLYDRSRPLENWVNKLISHALINLARLHWYKYARPCVSAGEYGGTCVFNTGGTGCSKTSSKIQCSECPMFAKWQKKKEAKFNTAIPVPFENHLHESYNKPGEILDPERLDSAKRIIDNKILSKLNKHEGKLYRLMYIDHLTMEQVGKKMKYKPQPNSKVPGYQVLIKFSRRIKVMAREIIRENELV